MRRLALAAAAVGVALTTPAAAHAATLTVNSVADQAGTGSLSDNICDSDGVPGPPNVCTLRAAIQETNANVAATDLINLPDLGFAYALDEAGAGEDMGVDGDLDVRGSVTITGSGQPVVNAATLDRVLHVGPAATTPALVISGVELRGGASVTQGGGVLVENGSLNMDAVTVTGNGAGNPVGVAEGGGLFLDAPSAHTITDSTIAGNGASGFGGARGSGLGVDSGTSVTISNSTISGNGADGQASAGEGGGIWSAGSTSLTHVTMSENVVAGSPAEGGLIYADAGSVSLRASILDRGSGDPGDQNCETGGGSFSSFGSNLEANPALARQCGTFGPGDLFVPDAALADLADRGGPTQTHALLNGSPALDVISSCFPVSTDQRGEPRPGAFACDIGSFERQVAVSPGSKCLGKAPTIVGFSKSEKVVGTPGNDVIVAAAGNDKVKGGEGDDRICGGKGKDRLRGGPGKDRIDGEDGKDELYGQAGADDLRGGSGRDVLDGGRDADKLNGGAGTDNCRAGPTDIVKACDRPKLPR